MDYSANKQMHFDAKFAHFKKYAFGSKEFRQYFRTDFIERDAGGEYLGIRNGFLYAFVCLFPVLLIAVVLGLNVDFSDASFLWLFPIYFLICNLVEYLLHRYPMHHYYNPRNKLFAHVTIHHNFYNGDHFYFEQHRDVMASLLPWYAFLGISAVAIGAGGFIYWIAGPNHALFFAFVSYSYYLLYEVLHATYHAPQDSWLKRLPGIQWLALGHLIHHRDKNMAGWNFNITFPIFDRIFKTRLRS